jgi:hypothetical protein
MGSFPSEQKSTGTQGSCKHCYEPYDKYIRGRISFSSVVYWGQLTQQILTSIKQNRHYCVKIRFYCVVGSRYMFQTLYWVILGRKYYKRKLLKFNIQVEYFDQLSNS